MSNFAHSLFSGSPFLRWTLGVVAFVVAAGFPFLMRDLDATGLACALVCELLLVLLLVAMIAPRRCAWAGRALAGLVFLCFVAYAIDMAVERPDSFWPPSNRQGGSSGFNALCGLVVIGLPALFYAVRGPRSETPSSAPIAADRIDDDTSPA